MVIRPDYLELAHNSVWTSFPYRERTGKKDWANREFSHARRFLDRAIEKLDSGLVGVVYRLARLAHYHAWRGMAYSDLERATSDVSHERACECWDKAVTKARKVDADFLRQFPRNPEPGQWNEHREGEKRSYHNWEGEMDEGSNIHTDGEEPNREPWSSDSDSWKPEGWQLG